MQLSTIGGSTTNIFNCLVCVGVYRIRVVEDCVVVQGCTATVKDM